MDALSELDEGRVFNSTHRVARELIAAGVAHDDAGRLRITEQGRCLIRHMGSPPIDRSPQPFWRDHRTVDEHVANLEPELKLPRNMDGPMVWARELKEGAPAALDRARAQRAAGVANGVTGVWTDDKWVLAFMDAYDQDGGV